MNGRTGWITEDLLQQSTAICAVLGALVGLIKQLIRSKTGGAISLEVVVVNLLSASSIPAGLLLLGCAFDKDLLSLLHDVRLYLVAAGVALLFAAGKDLLK